MPVLDFKDENVTFGKVLAALLRMGCLVEAREGPELVITAAQQDALIRLGLIPPVFPRKESQSRGRKKKA
jgi:hypothetical protein